MILYTFALDDGSHYEFRVELNRQSTPAPQRRDHAFWTKLTYNRCLNCPISAEAHPYCPAALDLEDIVNQFRSLISFQSATVKVQTEDRVYSKRCDVQTGLRSLVGLVLATSGCPILSRLKGMAHYHLPFANIEETVVRTVGTYLLKQYFVHKDGGRPDLDLRGLASLYDELQTVTQALKVRIDAASERDANMNAIGSLVLLGMAVSFSLEERLAEIKPQFADTTSV